MSVHKPYPVPDSEYRILIDLALTEDIGRGDETTRNLFPAPYPSKAEIRARQMLVIAGLWLVPEVFNRLDPAIEFHADVQEGDWVKEEGVIARMEGDARPLLTGERVALNFLQRLCGIATLTARFVEAVKGSKVRIMDTRKTTPGWRLLEKYAVRMGGGENHRPSLDSKVLVKDNHISLVGNLKKAIRRARKSVVAVQGIVVEVDSITQIEKALEELDPKLDILMLDNMNVTDIRKAMDLIQGRIRVEVSGGVALSNVREIAACGVDFISVGALTHSAPAVDMSMDVVKAG